MTPFAAHPENEWVDRLQRLSPWVTLFLLSFAVRAWRVNDWLLPNVDEIVLMNTMNLRFLEGCSASSVYWPAHWIVRAFFFLTSFHHYRLISVLFGSATILVVYSLALRLARQQIAWTFCALLSFQWYLLYMSRIIEIASFIPLFTALCLWATVRWKETRRPVFALLFFGMGGIAANIWTPPMFYLVGAGAAFFAWEAIGKRLAWKSFLLCMVVLSIALAPYLYVLLTSAQIKHDILLRYQMTGASGAKILPANLVNPGAAIKTWTYLVTFFHEDLPWHYLAPFGIALLALPVMAARWMVHRPERSRPADATENADALADMSASWRGVLQSQDTTPLPPERKPAGQRPVFMAVLFLASAQIVLLLLSPVPLYIEGHAAPLLLCTLLLLLGVASSRAPVSIRAAGGGVLLLCLLASLGFAPYYVDNQQCRLREWLRANVVEKGVDPVCVSDGAHVKLIRIPDITALGIPFAVFTTAPDDLFWSQRSPGAFPIIISTYECNMDQIAREKGFHLSRQFTMNNLYEAHLRHGIDVWRVDNFDREGHKGPGVQ